MEMNTNAGVRHRDFKRERNLEVSILDSGATPGCWCPTRNCGYWMWPPSCRQAIAELEFTGEAGAFGPAGICGRSGAGEVRGMECNRQGQRSRGTGSE